MDDQVVPLFASRAFTPSYKFTGNRNLTGMLKPRAIPRALTLPFLLVLVYSVLAHVAVAQGTNRTTSKWNTLSGGPPVVIARGGFSGIFPDSSSYAYALAAQTSLMNLFVWCDVQLTKDGAGICFPDISLENATNIRDIFPNNDYLSNGMSTQGYFVMNYTLEELSNFFLIQGVPSRTRQFDGNMLTILTIDDLVKNVTPPGLWLNIQHDAFYAQHNLSMRNFALSVARRVIVTYISSPEAGFLRSIKTRVNPRTTKLVFRFLGQHEIDPSTNQSYGSFLSNLTFIKMFASGILVPKEYIWPVDENLYLLPHTSLVSDAHKVGLEVFASGFANDVQFSYNYSYDPLAENLQFIDNGDFSVDGVLSDFPITPSAAIDCFAHIDTNAPKKVNTLVISKYGASGDYPPCTDLAYEKAISDGADIVDCPVQMSKDGIPFCLSSIDLIDSTTVARQSKFSKLITAIPEIKSGNGIFTFNLRWDDIKNLTPRMSNPYAINNLFRNPKNNKNRKLVTLSDFLNLTKNQASISGVMIIIEDAAYLAMKQNLSVTDAVIDTLSKVGYDKLARAQKVMIQSTNSSVLLKFKEKTNYELVYKIDDIVDDIADSAIKDIKSFADSVVVEKASVYRDNRFLLAESTKIVSKLKYSNLSVYAETFSNEYISQAYDFFSDGTVEINTFVQDARIDGIITDFPKTANRYRRNRCLSLDNKPPYMLPVQIGGLLQNVAKPGLPPALAPIPPLTESGVTEPPLPPLSKIAPSSNSLAGVGPAVQSSRNEHAKVTVSIYLCSLTVLVASLLF